MASLSLYKCFMLSYLALLGSVLAANNHGVTFLFPTTGQVLNYEDTVNVTWTSPFPKPLLYTFCVNSTNNVFVQEAVQRVAPYNGSQLIQLVWRGVSSCNFDLRPNTTQGNGADSPGFIVLPTARALPTTVGLGSPTSTSSSTSTATDGGDSSSSNTGTSDSSANSGLSSGAKAGIGVGVAIGAVAVIAALAFYFLRRRRSRNIAASQSANPDIVREYYGGEQKYQQVESTTGSDVQMQDMNTETTIKPAELNAEVAHELAAADVKR